MDEQKGFFRRRYKEILFSFTALLAVAIIVTMWYNSTHDVNPRSWFVFWKIIITGLYFVSFPVVLFFIIGGLIDVKNLFKILKEEKVDNKDDGFVRQEGENEVNYDNAEEGR